MTSVLSHSGHGFICKILGSTYSLNQAVPLGLDYKTLPNHFIIAPYLSVDIGYNSCNAERACQFNVYTNIGGCLCNSIRECVNLQPGIDKNYNNCPTEAPTSATPTPSSSPSSTPTTCATIARKVKIESTTKEQIQLFDVKVFSTSGVDETKGFAAVASQSSTFKNNERFAASNAIDNDFGSFSHTNDNNAWWQVDMGKNVEVRSLEIINRWCGGTISVPNTCLCRLSSAKVSLLDDNGSVISTQTLGNTCSEPSLKLDFDYNCNSCLPNASKLKLQSNTGAPLSLLEVEVYSEGVNVAANKIATASSTFHDLDKLAAGAAVDEYYTSFSTTNRGTDVSPWWEVNLGDSFDISNLKIFNRLNKNIPTGGLCNLSQVTILLLDANGKWVDAVLTGDTCGLLLWRHQYESSPQYCLRR